MRRIEVVATRASGVHWDPIAGGKTMPMSSRAVAKSLIVVALSAIFSLNARSADDATPSNEQIKHFLQTAEIINSKPSSKGVTHPWRLTLSDGTLTHDASFQPMDEHKAEMKLESGKVELNFVDSYKYNIAAYRIAELVGLDHLLPVYVERKWQGKSGSLSWWLPVKMDDADRVLKKLEPPDPERWNQQMFRIRIFDELVSDSDPNRTNVLIGEDWTVWRVDFSRAFRKNKDLRAPKDLVKCDRHLLERLKALSDHEVSEKTKGYLTNDEVSSVMARRDKLVATFQAMIAEKGEKDILY
jgi:hypothetical protein